MNYDFRLKEERRKFVKRANYLLSKKRDNVSLVDESNRTPNQNSYIHVLCRILAQDTGTSEEYAKQVYFKDLANNEIFIHITKDPITKKVVKFTRSTKDLQIPEMAKAITNFLLWAKGFGYELPEARLTEEGELVFASEKDKDIFHQAQIATSKQEYTIL